MTLGQEALAEAMRLEQARIYGRTQPEHRADDDGQLDRFGRSRDMVDSGIAYWYRQGQSVASIAFRLGITKRNVVRAIDRLGLAS